MTIDSAYQLELYNEGDDRVYFFEYESLGATTFVLWVDYVVGGIAYRDSPGTFAYEIEFEGRGPIYKRGKITLTDDFYQALAGATITRLTMQRKTPIYKDVTFETNGAWSSEGFEFEIDKICLIQQEIEGHYCDCREKEQGLDPIEDKVEEDYYEENPECRPYACDSFASYASVAGDYYWPCTNPVSDGFLAGTVNVPITGNGYSNRTVKPHPDWCDGSIYGWRVRDVSGTDALYIPQVGAVNIRPPKLQVAMLYIDNASTGTDNFAFAGKMRWSDGFDILANFSVLSGGTGLAIACGSTGFVETADQSIAGCIPADGKPHVIGFELDLPEESVPLAASPPRQYGSVTSRLYVDGVLVGEKTGSFELPYGAVAVFQDSMSTAETNFRLPGETSDFDFRDIIIGGQLNWTLLARAFARNFSDYSPPDWCIFPQG